MKEKAKQKRKALLDATLDLVNNHGFHNTPMSKIANLADVSPATIYLYFENKQDLINQLYLEIKTSFSQYAFKDHNENTPIKESFELIWYNIAHYKIANTKEALFLSQCDNVPIVNEEIIEQGVKLLDPLALLWLKGQKEGILKEGSSYLLYAFSIYPLNFLLNSHHKGSYTFDKTCLENIFKMVWDSIKK